MPKSDTNSETVIREMLKKLLKVYDTPETCIKMIIAYIDGIKMGASQEKKEGETNNERNKNQPD